MNSMVHSDPAVGVDSAQAIIRELMWKHTGILRSGKDLKVVADALTTLDRLGLGGEIEALEFQNMLEAAMLITRLAISRTESRGRSLSGGLHGKRWTQIGENTSSFVVLKPTLRFEPV